MRIEHLQYLIVLSETGSITKASQELFTSQQNISKIIRQIENEIDQTLFIRSKNGITLTEAGQIFLAFAKKVTEEYDKTQAALFQLNKKNSLSGDLNLYNTFLVNIIVAPYILQTFNTFYPELRLHIYEDETLEAMQKIVQNPDSIGIIPILNSPEFHYIYEPWLKQLQIYPLLSDEYLCLTSKESTLVKQATVSLKTFLQHPVVFIQEQTIDKNAFFHLFRSLGPFKPAFTSNNRQLCLRYLLNNKDAVLLTSRRAHNILFPNCSDLSLISFTENLQFTIYAAHYKTLQITPIHKAFSQFLKTTYRDLK